MAITRTGKSAESKQNKFSFHRVWLATAAALAISPCSYAIAWKVTPMLDLAETYTDNLHLAPPGEERSAFITQVSPGVSITGTGPRLKAKINYMMQNLAYSRDSNGITTNHQLNADGNAELIDHFFFLDGRAGISQQNISLFGPQPTDNTSLTGNRSRVETYSLSPYLRHRFDGIATSELRYTHDEVKTQVGGLSNSKADSALINLTSGSAFRTVGWGLHYNKQTIYFTDNPTVDTEVYSGDLRLALSPKFSLVGTGGRETDNYISTGVKPEGRFWTAGFSWKPSGRTSLDATTGERFFGRTHSLMATHHSRNTVWSLNYSEDITTTRGQFLVPATINTADFLDKLWAPSIPDPALRQQFIDSFIRISGLPGALSESVNFFTNRFFLQKQWQASVALNHSKSALLLSAFSTERQAQTSQTMDSLLFGTGSLAQNDSTKSVGGNAVWNWRYTPRTNVNVRAGYTRSRSLTTDLTTDYKTLGFGITKQFRPNVTGSVDVRHNLADSNQNTGNYRENAIVFTLHMTF